VTRSSVKLQSNFELSIYFHLARQALGISLILKPACQEVRCGEARATRGVNAAAGHRPALRWHRLPPHLSKTLKGYPSSGASSFLVVVAALLPLRRPAKRMGDGFIHGERLTCPLCGQIKSQRNFIHHRPPTPYLSKTRKYYTSAGDRN